MGSISKGGTMKKSRSFQNFNVVAVFLILSTGFSTVLSQTDETQRITPITMPMPPVPRPLQPVNPKAYSNNSGKLSNAEIELWQALRNKILNAPKAENTLKFARRLPEKLVFVTDELGNSLLHYAVQNNELKLVVSLLDRGLNPELKNSAGMSPLMLAKNNPAINPLLLNALKEEAGEMVLKPMPMPSAPRSSFDPKMFGSNPRAYQDPFGRPLTDANKALWQSFRNQLWNAMRGVDMVQFAAQLHNVSDNLIFVTDELGNSLLHYAVKNNVPNIAVLLIDRGLNAELKNNAGISALDLVNEDIYLDPRIAAAVKASVSIR